MRKNVLIGIIATLCIAVGWLLLRTNAPGTGQPNGPNGTVPATVLPLKPPREAPAGYTEYRNERYRFSLFHPDSLKLKEFDEGGGAATITFQDVASAQGFQIFVVPYGESQVSEARFKQDVPSGVRKGSRYVIIAGVTAASFYSSNTMLGDTAEIWFINGGYLFEVTTPKSLSGWLSPVMTSWEFI